MSKNMSNNYRRSAYRGGASRSRGSSSSSVRGPLIGLAVLGLLYLAVVSGALEAIAGWFGQTLSDNIVDLDGFDRKLRRDGHRFAPDQRKGLNDLNLDPNDRAALLRRAAGAAQASCLTMNTKAIARPR